MSVTRDDLLAVIAENPADENAWLLYADWLQQHGEPRGELIALDIALETATDRKPELEAARVALLASYGAEILGETFAKFVASGYGEVVWHRGFITVFGYAGNERVTHLRKVGWLVKLILDNPEPFTFLKKLTLSHTDIADVVPFAQFKHLVEIDVRSTNVRAKSVAALAALRPSVRVRITPS